MSWDDVRRASGSKDYIRLKEGQSVEGIFRGEPYVFYQKYGEKEEYGEKGSKDLERKFRFKINMIVKEDDVFICKILSGGFFLITDIQVQIEEAESGEDSIFKVKRTGSGTDTRYAVIFKKALTKEQSKTISQIDLLELDKGRMREEELEVPDVDDENDADGVETPF